jgi:hypothetical protein
MRSSLLLAAIIAAPVVASSLHSHAQPAAPPPSQQPPAAQPDYHPSAADLMNIGILPRHMKIAQALNQQNWAYLAYETNELRGAFGRVARTVPRIDGKFETAEMIQSIIATPIQQLADAAKAKDFAKSTAAYAAVTAACNSCHQAVNHGVIVIKVPQGDFFPNQDFRPQPTP